MPGWGLGAAILGGAIVGCRGCQQRGLRRHYYVVDGYRRCRWERQYDPYGFYVGTVKVCRVY